MIEKIEKPTIIIWQTIPPEEGVSNPPVVITQYTDCFHISQNNQRIDLNYGTIDELIKVLKQLKTDRPF